MSSELDKSKNKLSGKDQTFIGKKTESSNFSIKIKIPLNNCKICENKNNLFKCSKCGYFYCNDCIKQLNRKNISKIKESEFICSNCSNNEIINKKNKESQNTICYLCGNKFEEKNLTNYKDGEGQRNDLLSKGLSLDEKEDEIKIKSQKLNSFKICNNSLFDNNEILGNISNKKYEIKKANNSNIIDELTSIISKDKGETNIFNILDNKSDNSSDNNIKDKKGKGKDLFDTIIVKKKEKKKEVNQEKEQNKYNIDKVDKNDNSKNNEENINKNEFQNILGNDLFLKNLNINNNINKDDDNNISEIQINKNENEAINNILNNPSDNINNNLPINSNLFERNVNSFLNMNANPPSININSNNKTSNIYIPHFFTATPLQSSQSYNPIIPNININNSLSPNLLDIPNMNDNLNSLADINLLNNSINNLNNSKNISSDPKLIQNNNKYNSNTFNKNIVEDNKNILNLLPNLNQNNLSNNNLFNFDLNQNNINNNTNNLNNLNNITEGINNKLKELGETLNINNLQSNINDKNIKKDYLFNSLNSKGNNLSVNINNNLIGVKNEIKVTLNKISKDLYSFDNNNIENNLNILNNSETLTKIFSQILTDQINQQNKAETNKNNNNMDNVNLINNQKSDDITDKPNSDIELKEGKSNDTIKNKDMNVNELLNASPSSRVLIKYILSVNESLMKQLKTLRMYVEIQKVFTSIIFQKFEIFLQNLSQNQAEALNQSKIQQILSQNKDIPKQTTKNSQNNILSQIKELNPQNNQNMILPQINPPPQIPINSLNNLQNINPIPPSSSSLLNSSNLNYNSPISLSPLTQFMPNNNLGRSLPLFNLPGQQFKQDFASSIPSIFNGNLHFPLYPQQQGINSVGNPIIGQNLPQILPLLNQMNNSGNNNLQFDNQKNNLKSN